MLLPDEDMLDFGLVDEVRDGCRRVTNREGKYCIASTHDARGHRNERDRICIDDSSPVSLHGRK